MDGGSSKKPTPGSVGSLIPSLCAPEGRRNGSATEKEIFKRPAIPAAYAQGRIALHPRKSKFFCQAIDYNCCFYGAKKITAQPKLFFVHHPISPKAREPPKKVQLLRHFQLYVVLAISHALNKQVATRHLFPHFPPLFYIRQRFHQKACLARNHQ